MKMDVKSIPLKPGVFGQSCTKCTLHSHWDCTLCVML